MSFMDVSAVYLFDANSANRRAICCCSSTWERSASGLNNLKQPMAVMAEATVKALMWARGASSYRLFVVTSLISDFACMNGWVRGVHNEEKDPCG